MSKWLGNMTTKELCDVAERIARLDRLERTKKVKMLKAKRQLVRK